MTATDLPPILRHLPPAPDEDALLDGFTAHTSQSGVEMYPAQEESLLDLIAGSNVILNTPTGSGKSLVAVAAHFVALAREERSVYTAPIKALVSEKFFQLCDTFGSDLVGMITGDGSVNPDAPIICCTAEILANWALRDGADTDVQVVIADEFHFYADPQRGWAWQLPLLELSHCQFLLMSATLGSTSFFEQELTDRTGRETALVSSTQRPVPLDFEYRTTTLHRSIEDLLSTGRAPIYLVHFTQREATEAAQGYLSLDPLTKDEKQQVKDLIGGFRFDSPFGRTFRRFLVGGVGVHHAGLLPKYRLLVERLAQAGLLKIICGTDTLGVGVNVPIRSVLFTQLCKYDGSGVRVLRVREFQQIAGRAGRRGFDDRGDVWVQAPEHVVDNQRMAEQAETDAKKRKKMVRKKPPERGYAHWDEATFDRLVGGEPEPLTSSFDVNHQMVMSLLDRPGDGCAAVRRLMVENHEPRRRQRHHIRRAISIYRSLADANLLEFPDPPDDLGRRVRVNFDLQDEFALHQPLSLWAIDAIIHLDRDRHVAVEEHPRREQRPPRSPDAVEGSDDAVGGAFAGLADLIDLDRDVDVDVDEAIGADANETGDDREGRPVDAAPSPDADLRTVSVAATGDVERALAVLTIVEAVQENPAVVIAAQLRRAKDELMAEMKSSGVEYEERMERLAKVEPPRPLKDWIYADFNEFRRHHPWVGGDTVKPKSVVRDLLERAMTFGEYIDFYGLKNSEGAVLRYLSDVFKGLVQNVPVEAGSSELDEIVHWLGALVRHVDSSLIDEWERLQNPDEPVAEVRPEVAAAETSVTITSDARAFRTMVRNEAFGWVEAIARRRRPAAAAAELDLTEAMAAYWDEYDSIDVGGDARHTSRFVFDEQSGRVEQTVHDPEGHDEWRLLGVVDLDASRAEDRLVASLVDVVRLG
ncbi:DEAD/DEAH box helicase [Ilumatobacter sp.]|uniref:DEAD/DEAH box helicase n=1 Tax=Ilumatobacter sp. TaxID=1967498 RepID=UPI003AF83804